MLIDDDDDDNDDDYSLIIRSTLPRHGPDYSKA